MSVIVKIKKIFLILILSGYFNSSHAQISVDPGMSGSWYDPSHSGEGFVLQILENGIAVAYWFTYDDVGAQRWFIATGSIEGNNAIFDELYQASGAEFGDGFDPNEVELINVGNLNINWSDCSNANANYTVNGIDGNMPLTRLTKLSGLDCNSSASSTSASVLTGSWYDRTHSGEGLAVEIHDDGNALAYWFSFDNQGNQSWFIGVGSHQDNVIDISEMLTTSGGRFGPEFNPDDVEITPWGSIRIELDCDFGKLDYESEIPIYGSGKQTLSRLTKVGTTICEDEPSPNILLVIADDLGLDASVQYSISAEQPITPTLNQLANNGLVFDNAWSSPTCTPTRAGILTGKYGSHTGMLEVGDVLSENETSLQSYIHQHLTNKYSDAVIGKWHVGPERNGLDHPESLGVSHYAGIISGGVPSYNNWNLVTNGVSTQETKYVTSKLVDLAIDWTGEQDKPWFLWLAFNAPHTPFHLPPSQLHNRQLSGTAQDIQSNPMPYYFAAIESMDTEIGRLLDSLDQETRDNTIIIFMGDNGTPRQVSQFPYAEDQAKGSLYQGGINIPFMISGPGVNRVGERESGLINTLDLFSTIASLTGVNVDEVNDSISINYLLSEAQPSKRLYQFSERRIDTGEEWTISDGDYKLIETESGLQELYQLSNDPYENSELILLDSAPPTILNNLSSLAEEIRREGESSNPD